jgi:hypothetical protein
MRTTLLQRPGAVKRETFTRILEEAFLDLKGELDARIKMLGFSSRGYARVELQGDDSEIVLELVSRRLGLAHTEFSAIELYGNYEGIVTSLGAENLDVDLGIENPKPLRAKVKVSSLRAQLTDGKTLPLREIVDHYCLYPESKVTIRITELEPGSGTIEGWLADSQLQQYSEWIGSGLDRIQVFNCSHQEVESAIRRAKLERDIVSTEPMTLTSHSVLCKLGTDGIGLIPKLGRILRESELKPFLPKRIRARCRPW